MPTSRIHKATRTRLIALFVVVVLALGLSAATQAQSIPTDDPAAAMTQPDDAAESPTGTLWSLGERIKALLRRLDGSAEFERSDRVQPDSMNWKRWLEELRARPEETAEPFTHWLRNQLREAIDVLSGMLRRVTQLAGSIYGPNSM